MFFHGTNIFDLLVEKVGSDSSIPQWATQNKINQYGSQLEELARNNLEVPDIKLSIYYQNGVFSKE